VIVFISRGASGGQETINIDLIHIEMIFSPEIRAGRALLGWSQTDLAKAASVGIATVRRLEAMSGEVRGSADTLWRIQKALEDAGVQFIAADEYAGAGVRLKYSQQGKPNRGGARRRGIDRRYC
jgi:transcriptional regulator with XRE-family HTH domain